MKFFLFTFLLMTCFCSAQIPYQLRYEEFLSNVLKFNPLSMQAENETRYSNYLLKAAKGSFDPLLSGNYNQKKFGGVNYFTTLNSEVKQPIFSSQYLKFGYDFGSGMYINPEQKTSSIGLPYLGIEVSVLQGLIIDKRRAELLKAKEYLNYYSAEKNVQLNLLLFEASQRYFEWLLSIKQVSLNQYFMELAGQRLKGIEELVNYGERASIDTVESMLYYKSRLMDYQNALINIKKAENDMTAFNWKDNTSSDFSLKYKTLDSIETYFIKAKVFFYQNLNAEEPSNPILIKYASFQKVLEIENRFKKELLKPNLNLKYNLLSNNAVAYNSDFYVNNCKFGINLSFPVFLRIQTSEYKIAKLKSQNNNLEILNKTNELNSKISTVKNTIVILTNQLEIAAYISNNTKLLLDAEQLKFDNGESNLFMLNQRENKVLESEIKLAEFKLKYIVAVLNLIYLNGSLNYSF